MNETNPKQLFNIGDTVRVVSRPYLQCPLSWVSDMNAYCGREMKVSNVVYDKHRKLWIYSLSNCMWNWCENCFEPPIADIEESDEDISVLFE